MADTPRVERFEVAVRAYGIPPSTKPMRRRSRRGPPLTPPSGWTLVWDPETTVDAAQQFRVGGFQVRQSGLLHQKGLFYDPASLSDRERALLYRYALDHKLEVYELDDFIERIFFRVLVDLRGTCINFNAPFDVARPAMRHEAARSLAYRGGFTFVLSGDPRRPHIQIRHLNSAESLIRFTVPAEQPTPRGMRKRRLKVPAFRGWFCDVHTLAAALLEHRGDLRSLVELLDTATQKGTIDFEYSEITSDFLAYAMTDVQVTWECYERLAAAYAQLGLVDTPLPKIYSAASVGKGHLNAMGVRPWADVQPNFRPDEIGRILSSYFGGRAEVHLRRTVCRVLYADFLAMYPTVCALMGLWQFVTASGIRRRDVSASVQKMIDTLDVDDLQRKETWERLAVLVELAPDADLFPVRAKYDRVAYTIGLNYYTTGGQSVWYPLADVLVAALLGHKRPRILRAIAYEPRPPQTSLKPIDLMGKSEYRVDPAGEDVFRRLVELRTEVKRRRDAARASGDRQLAEQIDAEQLALKITANAMSYGIFIELNVTEYADPNPLTCFGRGEPFSLPSRSVEAPGRQFHPLVATLVTAGARLMLALAEHRILGAGLNWTFCDTDSMAIACPAGMSKTEFLAKTKAVLASFEPLKPYAIDEPLLKLEDANYALGLDGRLTDRLAPLYCFAVSDKRYVLFNLDANGRPILRKASAHGLGHLRPPYEEANAPASIPPPVVPRKELGAARWQHDLWYRIIEAAIDGHPAQVRLDDLPGFDAPAVSRYAATTPQLLGWFDYYNAGKPYREQVRPFGFLLAFQARPTYEPRHAETEDGRSRPRRRRGDDSLDAPAVVAPYAKDPSIAAKFAFDRGTGAPVPASRLRSYREVLAQYHLHPETKFHNGDYLDAGQTSRRHVSPLGPIDNIGKEANRWEEQFYLGANPEAQIAYGVAGTELGAYATDVRTRAEQFGVRAISREAFVSVGTVSAFFRGLAAPRLRILRAIDRATGRLGRSPSD